MRVSSSLLIVVAAQLLSAASVAGSRVGEVSRQLNRAERLAASGLECSVSTAHGPSDLEATYFEYWYAMGSEGPIDPYQQNVIETRIFDEGMKGMVWCTSIQNEDGTGTRHLTETARELGILAVNSGSATVQTKFKCSIEYASLARTTGAADCTVVKGMMRILAHKVDNVDYLIASLRDYVEASMVDPAAYNGPETPNLIFLSYLGDSSDQALNDGGDGDVSVWELDFSDVDSNANNTNNATTYIDGGFYPAGLYRDEVEDDDSVGLIIGVTIPLIVGLIVAALFMQKKRGTMTEAGYSDMMTSDFVLIGTGDHPSSFHEGLYHYMRDGTRYLSTRCEGCLETRKNSFYTDNNLGTIMEDEEFEDVTGLGAKTSTVNVHKCTSAVCTRCTPAPDNQTCFVAASGIKNRVIISDDDNLVFNDVQSTGASPRAADHMEV